MMVNTSQAMPMMIHSGIAITSPMPRVSTASRNSTKNAMPTVMLKLSASLPWSSTNGIVSFLTSQMISGPMKQPMLPAQPEVRMPPTSADRSEEHTSELQSLMRNSSAVFCLKKQNNKTNNSKR